MFVTTAKDDDILIDIRNEYRQKKQQLNQYDTLLDNQGISVGIPSLLLVVCAITALVSMDQPGGEALSKITGIASIVLLVIDLVLAIITGVRKSTKDKLERHLKDLKNEAVMFQKHAGTHKSVSSRDELKLWHDIEENKASSHHKLIGVSIIVVTLAVLLSPIIFGYLNTQKNLDSNSTYASQAKCLDNAYTAYDKAWKAADKDGDDMVSFRDGSTDIINSYYDSVISCYREYKTENSEEYIADYKAKRQQEVDKYNKWLESSKSTSSNSGYRSSISCTSSSIGSTTFTNCY